MGFLAERGVPADAFGWNQRECLQDDAVPIEDKKLPEDLAALDLLLSARELLLPIVER